MQNLQARVPETTNQCRIEHLSKLIQKRSLFTGFGFSASDADLCTFIWLLNAVYRISCQPNRYIILKKSFLPSRLINSSNDLVGANGENSLFVKYQFELVYYIIGISWEGQLSWKFRLPNFAWGGNYIRLGTVHVIASWNIVVNLLAPPPDEIRSDPLPHPTRML